MKATKIAFLILLVIVNCTFFFCEDETSDYSNDYSNDFTIGGSIVPVFYQMKFNSAWALIKSYDIDSITDEEIFNDEIEKLTGTPPEYFNLGGGVNFILSYSHYYKFNSSVGITFSFGYLITPYYPKERTILMINNIVSSRILLLRKIGKPTNKVKFFYELGMIANFEIPYYPNGKSVRTEHKENKSLFSTDKILYKYTYYYPDFMFGLGPYFDLGIEFNINKFNLAICMFSWVTLGSVFDDAYENLETEPFFLNPRYNIIIVPIGIEVRFQFYKIN